jgi:hypothetical protein
MIKEIKKYFKMRKTICTTIVFLQYKFKLTYEQAAHYMTALKKISYKHDVDENGNIWRVFFR